MISKKAELPKNVRLLGWVSFFTDVSSEMIFPLLPVFLTTVLKASPFSLGLIEGISDAVSSLLKLFSGYFADRFRKRRLFIFVGYGLSSFLRPLIGLASHWTVVLGLRFGDRIGKGIRSAPRDTMIATTVPIDERGRAFGFHRMMDHAGAVVGSFLGAGLIFLAPGKYRMIFLLAALPALCALLVLSRVRESSKEEIPNTPSISFSSIRQKLPRRVKIFLGLLFVFSLGNATDAFLILRLQESGVPVEVLPLLWGGFHIVKAWGNHRLGTLSDRRDRSRFVFLGWFLYSLAYLAFLFPLPKLLLVSIFFAYGLFYGLTEGPEKGLLADWVPQEYYGSAYGLYHALLGLALLPASLLFGFLWKIGGYPVAFGTASAITAGAAVAWGFYSQQCKLKN